MGDSEIPVRSWLDIAGEAWAFTQTDPLTTEQVITTSQSRGVELDRQTLQVLHEQQILSPALEIHDAPTGRPVDPDPTRPRPAGTLMLAFVSALGEGRITDPSAASTTAPPRFDGRSSNHGEWWNGLIYSRWQLLTLPSLRRHLADAERDAQTRAVTLPPPDVFLEAAAHGLVRIAQILTAIDTRYLPGIRPGVLHLRNVKEQEWFAYRDAFDAAAVAERLGVTAEQLISEAERLLTHARGLGDLGSWYHVVKHAPPKKWDRLGGDTRSGMEYRIAAELLLQFAEDLDGCALEPPDGHWWTPLHDRLTRRAEPLEEALADHGVAPGPRVVVIVEGQSELLLARRISERMRIPLNALGIRIIAARGAGGIAVTEKNPIPPVSRVAAHVVTPVVTGKLGDNYDTLQPLCGVLIVGDPDDIGPVDLLQRRLLREVQENLADQGVDDVPDDVLSQLIRAHAWDSEFEFAHFTDTEIAAALRQVHPHVPPIDDRQLTDMLQRFRAKPTSIRNVWKSWTPTPSKTQLAEALWPVLEERVTLAESGAALPPLAAVLHEARDWATELGMVRHVLPAAHGDQ